MKPRLLRPASALLLLAGLAAPLLAGGGQDPPHGAAPPAAPAQPAPQAGVPAHAESLSSAATEGGEEPAHGAAAPAGPHARAPLHVPLRITEPARVVSPGEEYVDSLAGKQPGRFRKDGEHWVDNTGEFAWDEDEEIYWQTISADQLTRGRQDFVQFCSSCHGLEGDGYGRSAQHLRPPPRSFQQSTFKFTKVPSDKLPNDDAIITLVRHGLDGTPMYKWAVSEERLHDIVQYIKSLSPEGSGWRDPTNEIGAVVETAPDPWTDESAAIAAGEAAYHRNQCYGCHPAYVTAPRLNEIRGVDPTTAYGADLTYPKLKKDSSYEVLGYKVAILPPDFTWQTMRYSADARETYQTIASGIGGAGMPTWKGAMPDKDLWAIAHYVRHLTDTWKDKPGRAAFMAGLRKAP
ncbi:MAG TPA: cytochrome c [Planctomycetota bacterium]|nr:cytochrome c [Planctomycetota bacterium]